MAKRLIPGRQSIAIVSVEWDVVDLIESLGAYDVIGFFDLRSDWDSRDLQYLGGDDAWPKMREKFPGLRVALAIDEPTARKRLFDHYGSSAIEYLQSPHAHVSARAAIGEGSIVQYGAVVMPNAEIGVGCKLNVNCSVHHDAKIGAFSTLAPDCQILGDVKIGERVYVGAGAVVRQHCRVASGAVVGAGAVVVNDIAAGEVVVGVPATRRLKRAQ